MCPRVPIAVAVSVKKKTVEIQTMKVMMVHDVDDVAIVHFYSNW